jgi:hypothetical protein
MRQSSMASMPALAPATLMPSVHRQLWRVPMKRLARFAPLLSLPLLLAACGGEPAVAATSVQTSAVEQFSQQFQVESVDCPDDLPAEVGAQITCVLVDGAGDPFEMTVTVTTVDGADVDYDLELTAEL